MASGLPMVRQVAWLPVILKIELFAAFGFLANTTGFNKPFIIGMLLFLAFFYFMQLEMGKIQRRGVSFLKKEKHLKALPHFLKSYDFFKRNEWLDRYRHLMLMVSSRVSFTEMALLSIAFCYAQTGQGIKSRETYELALKEFPDSEVAKISLRAFDACKEIYKNQL